MNAGDLDYFWFQESDAMGCDALALLTPTYVAVLLRRPSGTCIHNAHTILYIA